MFSKLFDIFFKPDIEQDVINQIRRGNITDDKYVNLYTRPEVIAAISNYMSLCGITVFQIKSLIEKVQKRRSYAKDKIKVKEIKQHLKSMGYNCIKLSKGLYKIKKK